MSEIRDQIYIGCYMHHGEFQPTCLDCGICARGIMSEIIVQLETRVTELEKKWEERLNGNLDHEYNRVSVRREVYPTDRVDTTGSQSSGSDATPATGDRGVGEREDSVGRRRRRQEFDRLGILHEEGGNQ